MRVLRLKILRGCLFLHRSFHGFNFLQTLGDPPDGIQGFGRVLLDSALNLHGSVDLYVEDAIDIAHGQVHSYFVDMDDVLSSSYEGDMKVQQINKGKGG